MHVYTYIYIYTYPIGGFNPSEKYESHLGWLNSQYMSSHKIHVPNHQPDTLVDPILHHILTMSFQWFSNSVHMIHMCVLYIHILYTLINFIYVYINYYNSWWLPSNYGEQAYHSRKISYVSFTVQRIGGRHPVSFPFMSGITLPTACSVRWSWDFPVTFTKFRSLGVGKKVTENWELSSATWDLYDFFIYNWFHQH